MKRLWPVFILLALAACLRDESISGQTTAGEIWQLVTVNGSKAASGYTLQFPERGKLSGNGPCNSFQARQTAPLPWFEVRDLRTSGRSCDQFANETAYFEALSRMTLIERKGSLLLLSSDSESLEFRILD